MNNEITEFIKEINDNIKFKTKVENLECHHGSSKGDIIESITYWNDYTKQWTTKEEVITSHVMHKLSPYIKKIANESND